MSAVGVWRDGEKVAGVVSQGRKGAAMVAGLVGERSGVPATWRPSELSAAVGEDVDRVPRRKASLDERFCHEVVAVGILSQTPPCTSEGAVWSPLTF